MEKTTLTVQVRQAALEDLNALAPLFDAYRVACGEKSHLPESKHFLFDRLLKAESLIWVAEATPGKILGFAQLYPAFSSQTLQEQWFLSDLYVYPDFRRQGLATQLLATAELFCQKIQAQGFFIHLTQANTPSIKLAQSRGYAISPKGVAFYPGTNLS